MLIVGTFYQFNILQANNLYLIKKNLVIRVAITIIKHNLIIGIPVVQSLVCSVL